jgi:hypothetical protein
MKILTKTRLCRVTTDNKPEEIMESLDTWVNNLDAQTIHHIQDHFIVTGRTVRGANSNPMPSVGLSMISRTVVFTPGH